MENFNSVSEKYRKYLLAVLFEGSKYYTVCGMDLSDNETEKLLVDAGNNLLLFRTPGSLLSAIPKAVPLFDDERLYNWAKEVSGIKEPYAVINIDALSVNNPGLENIALFKEIYTTVGIIEDYAIQVNAESLLEIFRNEMMIRFKDDLADYYLWSENETLQISGDIDDVFASLNRIYKLLKPKLAVQ